MQIGNAYRFRFGGQSTQPRVACLWPALSVALGLFALSCTGGGATRTRAPGEPLETLEQVVLANDPLVGPAQQGIANSGAGSILFWTTEGDCFSFGDPRLYAYRQDSVGNWTELASADIDYGESMCHIGDIVVHPDASRVYAPLSRFGAFFGDDKFQIATFSTTNLRYITHWDFTGIINAIANGSPGDYDLAGLTIHEHADGLQLYAVLWNEKHNGQIIRWNLIDYVPESFEVISIPTQFANGIETDTKFVYISNGPLKEAARIDVYLIADIKPETIPRIVASYTYSASNGVTAHAEGLTLHGTNMWVCAAQGNKVRRIATPEP